MNCLHERFAAHYLWRFTQGSTCQWVLTWTVLQTTAPTHPAPSTHVRPLPCCFWPPFLPRQSCPRARSCCTCRASAAVIALRLLPGHHLCAECQSFRSRPPPLQRTTELGHAAVLIVQLAVQPLAPRTARQARPTPPQVSHMPLPLAFILHQLARHKACHHACPPAAAQGLGICRPQQPQCARGVSLSAACCM